VRAHLTRRQLLKVAAALAAGFAVPDRAAAQQRDPLLEFLLAVRVDPQHLALYAEAYLAGHPGEKNPAVLIRALVGEAGGSAGADVRKLLREKIRGDFEEGRTVNLDGWILAESEVRLWCLIHLLSR
jgi:hypothetical protein